MTLCDVIQSRQREWLLARGALLDRRGYVTTLADNLFTLSDIAGRELSLASGNELGSNSLLGKIAAPWSSSALVVNVFEPWRSGDKHPLAAALEVDAPFTELRLEERLLTGFGAMPANLDVVLKGGNAGIVAIESKFLEPYAGGLHGKVRKTISPTYLRESNIDRWNGLHGLRDLAISIVEGETVFRRLDAPQLIKHLVALCRTRRLFELVHLWYSPSGYPLETRQMECELDVFRQAADCDGVRFRSMTYQYLFARLRVGAAERADYVAYLASRYFSDSD